jgi:hypothetical protein
MEARRAAAASTGARAGPQGAAWTFLGPRAAGKAGALYPGKWNPGSPTPPPGNAGVEDVRGTAQPKRYAKYWLGASYPEELEASRLGCSKVGEQAHSGTRTISAAFGWRPWQFPAQCP